MHAESLSMFLYFFKNFWTPLNIYFQKYLWSTKNIHSIYSTHFIYIKHFKFQLQFTNYNYRVSRAQNPNIYSKVSNFKRCVIDELFHCCEAKTAKSRTIWWCVVCSVTLNAYHRYWRHCANDEFKTTTARKWIPRIKKSSRKQVCYDRNPNEAKTLQACTNSDTRALARASCWMRNANYNHENINSNNNTEKNMVINCASQSEMTLAIFLWRGVSETHAIGRRHHAPST